jgi:hypothetical protein
LQKTAGTLVSIDNLLINLLTGTFINHFCKKLDLNFAWPGNSLSATCDRHDIIPTQIANCKISHRQFSKAEKIASSNELELIAAQYTVYSVKDWLRGRSLNLHVDNMNAANIIMNGSNKARLQYYAKNIFDICYKYDIDLNAIWIPRDLNNVADLYSKMYDPDSFTILDVKFRDVITDFESFWLRYAPTSGTRKMFSDPQRLGILGCH